VTFYLLHVTSAAWHQFQIKEHTNVYLKEVLFSSTQHILNNKSLHRPTLSFQFSYLNIPFVNPTVNKQKFLACIQLLFNWRKDYLHQHNTYLARNRCIYPASSSDSKTFISSTQLPLCPYIQTNTYMHKNTRMHTYLRTYIRAEPILGSAEYQLLGNTRYSVVTCLPIPSNEKKFGTKIHSPELTSMSLN